MSRKMVLWLVFFAMVGFACNFLGGSSGDGEAGGAFNPEADTNLSSGEHEFSEFMISEDTTVTLDGDVVIHVDGPVQIDGTITGDCTALEIRGTEDLTVDGFITNECSDEDAEGKEVRLIAEGDIILGTTESDEEVVVASGSIFISDPEGEDMDLTPLLPEDESSAFRQLSGSVLAAPLWARGGATRQNRPIRAGRGGDIANVRATGNVTAGRMTAGDGNNAPPLIKNDTCDNSNNYGGTGGSVRVAARDGKVVVNAGAILRAGDGGKGGDCTAPKGCPATAKAGKGGNGGSVLIGGEGIEFKGAATLIRGNGGKGGDAIATGDKGDAPCKDGCAATAEGGKGGTAGGIGYLILEPASIDGPAPKVDGANGGVGGLATATGGDGVDCDDCPGGDGGDGGDATAIGGQGGDGARGKIEEWPIAPNSHQKGNGGEAKAFGGNGGDGATCCNPKDEAGDGGAGGDATATGGQIGDRGLGGNGNRGPSGNSKAGDGGDGGDGKPPGKGGAGGVGTGDPNPVPDGNPGDDGDLCRVNVWIVFVGRIGGGNRHYQGWSQVLVLIVILGNDPEPMENATVSLSMTGQGEYQTTTVVTDKDGAATAEFPISMYGTYTVTVDNVEGENMEYDPSLNVADSVVVQVGPSEAGPPVPTEEYVEAFLKAFVNAIRTRDTTFLYDRLHSAVLDRYGEAACQAYIDQFDIPDFDIEILDISGPAMWEFERDDRSSTVYNAFSVQANVTSDGETQESEIHVAPGYSGFLRWFTDCGDPLQ
jgi:hypothetical protein